MLMDFLIEAPRVDRSNMMSLLDHLIHDEVQSFLIHILNGNGVVAVM